MSKPFERRLMEAARLINQIGANVELIVSVNDRQEGVRENIEIAGFAFHSLFKKADFGITS